MRAIAVAQLREIPRLMDVPDPKPRANELHVRLEFAGVNPFDWKIADGVMGTRPHTFPLVLGVDGAGTVNAVGGNVRRFRPGDRVFGSFLHDPIGIGTYAEFGTVPESNAVIVTPDGVKNDEGAALPTAGMTALTLVDDLRVERGSTIVIVGASGGVGSFATQLVANLGGRVIAVARSESAARVRALGAAEIIDPGDPDVVARVRNAAGDPVDGIADVVSDAFRFSRLASLVRPGGAAASTIGAANVAQLGASKVRGINIDMQPSVALLERLAADVAGRRLKVPIEARRPLSEGPAVIAEVRAGRGRGKTVLAI